MTWSDRITILVAAVLVSASIWLGTNSINARIDDVNARIDGVNARIDTLQESVQDDLRELRALVIDALQAKSHAD